MTHFLGVSRWSKVRHNVQFLGGIASVCAVLVQYHLSLCFAGSLTAFWHYDEDCLGVTQVSSRLLLQRPLWRRGIVNLQLACVGFCGVSTWLMARQLGTPRRSREYACAGRRVSRLALPVAKRMSAQMDLVQVWSYVGDIKGVEAESIQDFTYAGYHYNLCVCYRPFGTKTGCFSL